MLQRQAAEIPVKYTFAASGSQLLTFRAGSTSVKLRMNCPSMKENSSTMRASCEEPEKPRRQGPKFMQPPGASKNTCLPMGASIAGHTTCGISTWLKRLWLLAEEKRISGETAGEEEGGGDMT